MYTAQPPQKNRLKLVFAFCAKRRASCVPELNPNMSWEINVLAGQQLIEKAKESGVKQFIFASSGSVYGVKQEDKVTEDLPLVPISTYNKTKMIAERVFMSYETYLKVHSIRILTKKPKKLGCCY